MGFLGYLECDNCDSYVYLNKPEDINVWFHPDDPRPLAEALCPKCGNTVSSRIPHDHMANFKRRGVIIRDFNDKFEPLTEEMIEAWDIESEFATI